MVGARIAVCICLISLFGKGCWAAITGAGLPTMTTITMEKTGAFASQTNVKVGDVISFKLSIWIPNLQTDLKAELLAPSMNNTDGKPVAAAMAIKDVQVTIPKDPNFPNTSSTDRCFATYTKGYYDRCVIDFGSVSNVASDSSNKDKSTIVITFDAMVLYLPEMQNNQALDVSTGVSYENTNKIWVAEHIFYLVLDTLESTKLPEFQLSKNHSSINVGQSAKYSLKMTLYNAASTYYIDMYAPVNATGLAKLCGVTIAETGSAFSYMKNDDIIQFSRINDDTGTASLKLENIINPDFRTNKDNSNTSYVILDFSVFVMNTTTAIGNHWLGVSVMINENKIWSGQEDFIITPADNSSNPLDESPIFTLESSASEVLPGAAIGHILNMTIPGTTQHTYRLELAFPFNRTDVMSFCGIKYMHVGRNLQCFDQLEVSPVYSTVATGGKFNDYVVLDFGRIFNMQTHNAAEDNRITIRVCSRLMPNTSVSVADQLWTTIGVYYSTNMIWVARQYTNVTDADTLSNNTEVPAKLIYKMATNSIYEGSSGVYVVEIDLSSGQQLTHATLEFLTPTSNSTNATLLKICSITQITNGVNIYFDKGDVKYFNDYDPNSSDYNRATVEFGAVSNIGKTAWPERPLDNRIAYRIVVSSTDNKELVNATELMNSVSFCFNQKTCWVSSHTLNYTGSEPGYLSVSLPTVSFSSIVSSNNTYRYGEPIAVSADSLIPLNSVGNWKFSSASASLAVCRTNIKERGSHIACLSPNAVTQYSGDSQRLSASDLKVNGLTNIGFCPNNLGEARDNTITAEFIFAILPSSGATSFSLTVDAAGVVSSKSYSVTLNTTSAPVDALPLVDMSMDGSLPKGQPKVLTVDIYIPPSTAYEYTLEILAPCNSTDAGKLKVVSLRVLCAGNNVPCVNDTLLNRTLEDTVSGSSSFNKGVLNLGYVGNIKTPAVTNSSEIRHVDNKVTVEVVIMTSENATVGDTISTCGGLTINGQVIGVVTYNVDISTVTLTTAEPATLSKVNSTNTTSARVGDTLQFILDVTVGKGTDNLSLELNCTSPHANDMLCHVEAIEIVSVGLNVAADTEFAYEQDSKFNGQTPVVSRTVGLGLVANLGTSTKYCYGIDKPENNILKLVATIRLADSYYHLTPTQRTWSVSLSGSNYKNVEYLPIEIQPIGDERPLLEVEVNGTFGNLTGMEIRAGVEMDVQIRVKHANTSSAHAHNMNVYFRKPIFIKYLNSTLSVTGINTSPKVIIRETGFGVKFQWTGPFYFSDNVTLTFKVIVDEQRMVDGENEYKPITIPVDVSYCTVKRSNVTAMEFTEPTTWDSCTATDFYDIAFDLWIAAQEDYIGVRDRLVDCQIDVSSPKSKLSQTFATDVRYMSTNPFRLFDRGFDDEYIELCMGNLTLITAVLLQGDNTNYVHKFKLQIAKERFVYKYVEESSVNPVPKIFEVSSNRSGYPPGIPNDTYFVRLTTWQAQARCVRIIPVESNNGQAKYTIKVELYGKVISSDYTAEEACSMIKRTAPSSMPEYQRGYLINPHTRLMVFVCTQSCASDMVPVCSKMENPSTLGWVPLDDNLVNVLFHKNTQKPDFMGCGLLYGQARDLTFLRSHDCGDTWHTVSNLTRTRALQDLSDVTMHRKIPYETDLSRSSRVLHNEMGFSAADGTLHFAPNNQGICLYNSDQDIDSGSCNLKATWV